MYRTKTLIVVVIAATLGAPIGLAQNPAPTQSPTASSRAIEAPVPKPTSSNRIKTWSSARWNAFQEFWWKSQQKWEACVKESQGRKMSAHRKTHFLDECMQR